MSKIPKSNKLHKLNKYHEIHILMVTTLITKRIATNITIRKLMIESKIVDILF